MEPNYEKGGELAIMEKARAEEGQGLNVHTAVDCKSACICHELEESELMEEGGDGDSEFLSQMPVQSLTESIRYFTELLQTFEAHCLLNCKEFASTGKKIVSFRAHLQEAKEALAKRKVLLEQ